MKLIVPSLLSSLDSSLPLPISKCETITTSPSILSHTILLPFSFQYSGNSPMPYLVLSRRQLVKFIWRYWTKDGIVFQVIGLIYPISLTWDRLWMGLQRMRKPSTRLQQERGLVLYSLMPQLVHSRFLSLLLFEWDSWYVFGCLYMRNPSSSLLPWSWILIGFYFEFLP